MVDSKVKVAVRVRPMNQREIDSQAECVVYVEGRQAVLKSTCTAPKEFLFDHCFWSVSDEDPAKYTSQEDIFKMLGEDIVDSCFEGFNSCIFAYGQTGSGKTFSMMGTDDQPGLVPRICSALFNREINNLKSLQVEAAYLEIYNEKVRDLLYPTGDFKALRVREHKSFGPYVEGLTHHAVNNTEEIKSLILEGNKCRKIASTKMNEHSSRSHAIFTLTVTQTLHNEYGVLKELLSKVSLVDLAGSERTSISGATGDQLKESTNINKSLTFLGLVINSLAEQSEGKRKSSFINYRDSVLTWLLKNNLGGNSKTVMLATISPASINYNETLSTLKYADRAKCIVNKAMVNEDIKSKAIIELKEEVKGLREQLQQAEAKYKQELEAKLKESEKLLGDLKVSWEEKLKKTEMSAMERQKQLQRLGITVEHTGIKVDEDKCYLINLSIGMNNQNELLLYHLGDKTNIGAGESQDIQVTGPGIELEHCVIDISQDGEIFLNPKKHAETFVNGIKVRAVVNLSHEDKIKLGNKTSFILHKPNSKHNTVQDGADAVHNVSNQAEEVNREENESTPEERDISIGSHNIQCSHGENTDSVYMCIFSNDSTTMVSSGQNINIPQDRIVSPKIRNTKYLEQDSSESKIATTETVVSTKRHRKDEKNIQLKLISKNKKLDENNAVDNYDDTVEISITSHTDTAQDLSNNKQISQEDGDKTDILTNPTFHIEIEQDISSENQICKEVNDEMEVSVTSTSQTENEQDLSNKKQITQEEGDKTNLLTNSPFQAEMEQNKSKENQVSKEANDQMEISITSTSQTETEQDLSNKKQISKEDDKMNIHMNSTFQAEIEENVSSENQITKEVNDEIEISITSTSQTEREHNLSSKNQISEEYNNNETDVSITSTSPSAELSIQYSLITKSQNKPEKYDTSERHERSSAMTPTSENTTNYIRRARKEIMAALQKDFNEFLDEFDSKNLITKEEYFKVENMSNVKEKARALVNIILQKDESTCSLFLQCMQLNQEEKYVPEQEVQKSHIEDPKKGNVDKDDVTTSNHEEINLPEENVKKESTEKDALTTSKYEDIHLLEENGKKETKEKDKKTCFQDLLKKIEFQSYQTSKLTLNDVLDIGAECLRPGVSPKENVAWYFIRKLMSLHEEARNISTIETREEMSRDHVLMLDMDSDLSDGIHPLDLQCAILHCSDHFLQQEMISKMSMCQFSVPLLLPANDGPDYTFMLWAMRGIVKKWRPQYLAQSKGFQEENLVKISMPTFSFVRLGKCRLSKSKILNQILSSTQHCQDIFVHRDMEGGNVERTISLGLVEISWYFPAGKGIFTKPVAFTNLRGELESNLKPFNLLADVSSVVVVFVETISKTQCELLMKYKHSTYLFIITPEQQASRKEIEEMMESVMSMTDLKKDNVLVISKTTNEATAVKRIHSALLKLEKENANYLSVEDMARIAVMQKIYVDENTVECQAAEKHARAITEEICDVVKYKGKTMKLQMQLLKDLSTLEKELCQMKKQQNRNGENYKSELRRKCNEIRRKQWECDMPKGISHFIEGIKNKNRLEKFYFLSWLKYYLDLAAREMLTSLQEKYKEKYSQASDSKELMEIDQKISDSSLGIEHFLREVSQFYEVWHVMGKKNNAPIEYNHLPEIAGDLLLDGYPLELIDGDASRIPVQWVTDVLNKVHFKTGGRSKIKVITVLGVQSTGKSTLLNTMFGLQFPVASGRCTRGAFMTLIKVKEDFQEELGCEFLLVIDTEGLKAPELDSLEGSYEHDNELATLVVGLSDITVINMAMENITEMKDILQIVVHAFLRMKEIGKKPNCQFVHQNVSDVSAPVMNMRDRNKLLEQLNEMTKTVATIEKKPQYKVFSDVMEYDSEKHHWYIPSLWQGTPPMAPVSAGYSEHITELKQNLLKLIKQNQNRAHTLQQFAKWMGDLWNAVKHENFIFSFRNSLVAIAYNKLSMKYSELEWKFRKLIHEWFTNTETIIKNQSEDTLEEKGKDCCIRLENIIATEQQKMITWLDDYFKQEKDCVHLIKYKGDFIISVKMLGENLRRSSHDKYNIAIQIQKQQHKIKRVCKEYIKEIEHKVSSLMEECRKKQHKLDNAMLEEEFETMWQETVNELGVKSLIKRNIEKDMLLELTKTMRDKGSAVNEQLNQLQYLPRPKTENTIGKRPGIFTFLKSAYRWWKGNAPNSLKYEYIFQYILEKCCKYSEEQAQRDADYDDTYCKQLLNLIDDILIKEGNIPAELELEIKLKILGHAAADFQVMHNNFIRKNDPHSQLETLKSEYFSTFMNVFKEKNESHDLAKRICDTCLKPAIFDYIIRNLGIELVDDIMRSEGSETYTSRTFFQYTVLLNLLEENVFGKYVEYSKNYEKFVKKWILKYIKTKYSNFSAIQIKILSGITEKIRDLFNNPNMWKNSKNVEEFLTHFKKKLNSDLVLPQEKMMAIIFKNSANTKEFIRNLNNFLTDTIEDIKSEIESLSVEVILSRVTVKPQDELFKKVFGCGKQCPFCKVPCEAGGDDHKEHFSSVHRPKGLGTYRQVDTSILNHDICTTCVSGNRAFQNSDTNEIPHPYKQYKEVYPDWIIQPDPSIEASDYWKFVLKEFNEQFAREYDAKPANYPKEWNSLTKNMAKESLKKTFNMQ